MTVEEILEDECRWLGRPCKLLDSVILSDGVVAVTVVLYAPKPYDPIPLAGSEDRRKKVMVEHRVVAYAADQQLFSAIANSSWEEVP